MPKRKARPKCREVIIERELFPAIRDPVTDEVRPLKPDETWAGFYVTEPGGYSTVDGGVATQMRKMLAEGYFNL